MMTKNADNLTTGLTSKDVYIKNNRLYVDSSIFDVNDYRLITPHHADECNCIFSSPVFSFSFCTQAHSKRIPISARDARTRSAASASGQRMVWRWMPSVRLEIGWASSC